MRTSALSATFKIGYITRFLIFVLMTVCGIMKGHAQCEAVPPKNQWNAGQFIQTYCDYFKNIQDCDILGLIPKVDLQLGVKGYTEQCVEKSNTCNSSGPTPCGTLKNAQVSITADVHGEIPTGALGRSVTVSGTIFGYKYTFSGRLGLTIDITGTGSGSFSYTQNCDNSYCAAGSISAGGTLTPGGGGTVTFRIKHGGSGNYKPYFTALGVTLVGPIPFTLTGQKGWGTCESGTDFLKFCVGEIRPYIQISLPRIGSWQVISPDAWYDGTPGCG